VVTGLRWLDRTGAPWRAIPERYGPWSTRARRCARWQEQGLWQRILDAFQAQADAEGTRAWEIHCVASTIIRVHQHAAGATGDPAPEALGRRHSGFSTTVPVRAAGHGKPMTFVLPPGQRDEARAFEQLMEQGVLRRAGRGRPRLRPRRVVGDKGDRRRKIRQYLRLVGHPPADTPQAACPARPG